MLDFWKQKKPSASASAIRLLNSESFFERLIRYLSTACMTTIISKNIQKHQVCTQIAKSCILSFFDKHLACCRKFSDILSMLSILFLPSHFLLFLSQQPFFQPLPSQQIPDVLKLTQQRLSLACPYLRLHEVSTPMRCIAPIKVVSKTEQSSEKYLQELPIKGFVFEAVPLSSLEHKTNEPYAGRANKGLFTKPTIHWQMMPKEYFGLCFAFKARA